MPIVHLTGSLRRVSTSLASTGQHAVTVNCLLLPRVTRFLYRVTGADATMYNLERSEWKSAQAG